MRDQSELCGQLKMTGEAPEHRFRLPGMECKNKGEYRTYEGEAASMPHWMCTNCGYCFQSSPLPEWYLRLRTLEIALAEFQQGH